MNMCASCSFVHINRTIAESKKKYEEKHMKAQQLREKLREEKSLKLQKLLERVSVYIFKNKMTIISWWIFCCCCCCSETKGHKNTCGRKPRQCSRLLFFFFFSFFKDFVFPKLSSTWILYKVFFKGILFFAVFFG